MKQRVVPALIVCTLGLAIGCASSRPLTIDSALFIPPSMGADVPHSGDTGLTVAPRLQNDLPENQSPKTASILPSGFPRSSDLVTPLVPLQPTTTPSDSPITDQAMPAASALAPAAQPSIQPIAVAASSGGQGVFMTLGGVLAEVNNEPIYAAQVLGPLHKELLAKARQSDVEAFREFARQEISKQLNELIQDKLYFAAAYHELSDDDRKLAEAIAMQVRQERITAAGGSAERAKRQSLEDGLDFDESIKQEYRRIVHGLYQRRKIEPLIQVTADDMRDFYTVNVGKLYSEKDRAQFRVIEIDPAVTGSMASAREKINSLRDRALHGEDFCLLASKECQNNFLKNRAGNPCDEGAWMDRNTYRYDAVEAAVWNIQPGQITPVVETEGVLFIARLDAKKIGTVRQFDDRSVQEDVNARLRQTQLSDLWSRTRAESVDESMIVTDDSRIQVALDMAMQTYAQVTEPR